MGARASGVQPPSLPAPAIVRARASEAPHRTQRTSPAFSAPAHKLPTNLPPCSFCAAWRTDDDYDCDRHRGHDKRRTYIRAVMAATASHKVENWDDDDDLDFGGFQGNFNASTGTAQTSISSRLSAHSESVAGGDEDWNLVVNDEQSTANAIQSAKQAGIPLPENVPQSALLGGTIKRLGKKKSRQKLNDDWDNDIEMPDLGAPLKLKAVQPPSNTGEEYDDFDELEGSLGIRFGGTKRDARNRSSSASAMSPSLGSVTAESEVDDLGGLELPEGPMDFEAILKKRRAADAELSDLSQASPAIEQPETVNVHKKSRLLSDDKNDDYLNDFDLGGGGDILSKRANKNIKVKNQKPTTTGSRPATTFNFTEKPTDKPTHTRSHIPRPVSGSKPPGSRLEPVFETGASHIPRERRQPTTTSAQLLRSKRSMPALSSRPTPAPTHKASIPSFLPTAGSSDQQQHGVAHRPMPYHLRRDSDPHARRGAQSPPLRPHSRLSNARTPDTPSRGSKQRQDLAPSALAREAAAKRTVTKPARRRNYGDGNELEIFDDLPTSTSKESKYMKQPIARGPPGTSKPSTLRQTTSRTDMRNIEPVKRNIAIPDRMTTPAPPRTPASPTKGFHQQSSSYTPSYLRDTAASRIARETKLGGNPRPRSEGPLMPLSTNWKAQVAARSPHTSPSAQRQKTQGKKPQLIRAVGQHVAKSELKCTISSMLLPY